MWISVEEEKPKRGKAVILRTQQDYVGEGFIRESGRYYLSGLQRTVDGTHVTHWQPLPPPGQPDARDEVVEAAREVDVLTKGLKEKLPTYLPPSLVGGPPWEGTIEWSADGEKFLELRQALETLEAALARMEQARTADDKEGPE